MIYMLNRAKITLENKCVLVLGSGGTSNTATAVCKHLGAKSISVVSRCGEVNYENCYDKKDTEIIINTTPVGTYPNTDSAPIDLDRFSNLEGVVDVIYNPSLTKLLFKAKEKGIKYTSGLPMLVAQAKYAKDKFFDRVSPDSDIERVLEDISKQTQNIVLIGMPGSGKSTVGKLLSQKLGREFIDTDSEIVKKDGREIPQIFKESGEEYFRKLESQVLEEVGKLSGKIIATGGGVVKNYNNYFLLKRNGKIFNLSRLIEKLCMENRPLSKDIETVKKLYSERKELYNQFADFTIDNNGEVDSAVKGVLENL
jgi:shikimate dehydrogenase